MASGKITKAKVDALEPGGCLWDSETRGFGVRRQKRDATYVLKYRSDGRQRFITIGSHGSPWTPETARQRAKALLGEVAAGRDPAALRDERRSVPTLAAFAERYISNYSALHKGPRTVEEEQRNLRLHIIPAFGPLRMDAIKAGAIAGFMSSRSENPVNANRCFALLSHMFTIAAKWGVLPQGSNPCVGIEKYREQSRERYLSQSELMRLGQALEMALAGYPKSIDGTDFPFQRRAPEDARAVGIVRVLLLTGARLSEVQKLQWAWIRFDERIARLPESKTGAKNLNLPEEAIEVIRSMPRVEGNPFVFAGDRPGGYFVAIQDAWQRIRYVAGLRDVRLHDLRHSFASLAMRNERTFTSWDARLVIDRSKQLKSTRIWMKTRRVVSRIVRRSRSLRQ